jgi:hypothetical protein
VSPDAAVPLSLLALWAGCVPTPSTTKTGDTGPPSTTETGDTDTGGTSESGDTGTPPPTGDTGAPTGTCAGVALSPVRVCVETTEPQSSSTTYGPQIASGSGAVTEIGGVLAAVPGSARFASFDPCGGDHAHQVRVVDGAGETWTFGWDLPLDATDAVSVDGFLLGGAVDFHTSYTWDSYSSSRALVLSDAVGPLFVTEGFAYQAPLTEAQRGGIAIEVHHGDTCVVDDLEHRRVTFTGPDGPVDLWSGQRATVPLSGRDLDVTLNGAYQYVDCTDGCSADEWTAWETP